MLADFRAGQDGRIAEIMAYATTAVPPRRNQRLFRRAGDRTLRVMRQLPGHSHHHHPVLRVQPPLPHAKVDSPAGHVRPGGDPRPARRGPAALPHGPFGLGPRPCKGAGSSSAQGRSLRAVRGPVRFVTQKAINDLIVQMEEAGLLADFEKSGYRLLRLSAEGHARLKAQPEASRCPGSGAAAFQVQGTGHRAQASHTGPRRNAHGL